MEINGQLNLGFLKVGFKKTLGKVDLSKLSEKNREILQTRFEVIVENHENEIVQIFIDILNEMKSNLSNKEENSEKSDFILAKIDNTLNGDVSGNIESMIDKFENNEYLKMMWNGFFYDDKMKKLFSDLDMNYKNFQELLGVEVNNYFESGKEADINLLLKEKDELLSLLELYINKFEVLFLERLEKLLGASLINQIKPGQVMDNEKNTKAIENIQKFSDDIEKGAMKKYYKRFFKVIDSIFTELILKLKK